LNNKASAAAPDHQTLRSTDYKWKSVHHLQPCPTAFLSINVQRYSFSETTSHHNVIETMFTRFVLPFLAMQMLASATPHQHRRANGVEITSLTKNVTSTSGSGNVAAAGNLTPFGDIGVGCGINWQADVSYGGTLFVLASRML
jgi:hypothetical protein